MKKLSIILFVSLLMIACSEKVINKKSVNDDSVCHDYNFKQFVVFYSDLKGEQKTYTKIPLQKMYLNKGALYEPTPVELMLESNQIDFPVFPDSKKIKSDGLVMKIVNKGGEGVVSLFKPDSDYKIDYYFKNKICWQLFRIENWSL